MHRRIEGGGKMGRIINVLRAQTLMPLLIGMLGSNVAIAGEIALVTRVRGLVSAEVRGGSGPVVIGRGHLVMPGTVIQTGRRGFAEIVFLHSRSHVFLRPGAAALFYESRDSAFTTELVTIENGDVYIEARKRPRSSFDVGLPGGLATLDGAHCLVVMPSYSSRAALFATRGRCRVTDSDYSRWRTLSAPAAAFIDTSVRRVQTASLSAAELPAIREYARSARTLSSGRMLTHSLTIKKPGSGNVRPFGMVTLLTGAPLRIVATAVEGMRFSRWNVLEGTAIIESPAAESTHVRIASHAVIEPLFTEKPNLLVVEQGEHGRAAPAGEIALDANKSIAVRATADSLYRFAGWEKSRGVRVDPPESDSVIVTLEREQGRLKPIFERVNDTIRVQQVEGAACGPDSVIVLGRGLDTLVTVQPDSGFAFVRWGVVEGAGDIDSAWNRTARIRAAGNCAVRALVAAVEQTVSLTIESAPRVRISPAGTVRAVKDWLVPLAITVDSGYQVNRWEIIEGRAQALYKNGWRIQSRTDAAVRPVVGVRMHTLHVVADSRGSVRPSGKIQAGRGVPVALFAAPDKGNEFVRWRIVGGTATLAEPYSAQTEATLTVSDAALRAEFSPTICSLSITASKGGYTQPAGAIRLGAGEELILQATPGPKAAFLGWKSVSDSGIAILDSLSSQELTVIAESAGAAELHAEFSTETVELIVLENGMGTVDPGHKSYIVKNRWHTIEAKPNAGQTFVQWTAVSPPDLAFKDKTARITQINPGNQNCIIKPIYSSGQGDQTAAAAVASTQPTDSITAMVKFAYSQQQGVVTPAGPLTIQPGAAVQIAATSLPGYRFVEWRILEGSASLENQYASTTMLTADSGPVTVAARFTAKPVGALEVRFTHENGSKKSILVRYQ